MTPKLSAVYLFHPRNKDVVGGMHEDLGWDLAEFEVEVPTELLLADED
jgi:hypothetical protein